MRIDEINPFRFCALRQRLGLKTSRESMVDLCRADDSDFCREVIASGRLTETQMAEAAARYRLGKSRSGKTIFWMIDEQGILRDGYIDGAWVSEMLRQRCRKLLDDWHPAHCLFGLHLLSETTWRKPVAIVESAPSAVVLSAVFPQNVWLASVTTFGLTIDKLEPLKGHRVTLFPRTDPEEEYIMGWMETAYQARQLYGLDINVNDILEEHATPGQKARGIDIVDYLFEQQT